VASFSSLRTDRLYCQKATLVLIPVIGWVEPRVLLRPERLSQWALPMTPWGIEPATFRLVAQCLNQLRHWVLPVFELNVQLYIYIYMCVCVCVCICYLIISHFFVGNLLLISLRRHRKRPALWWWKVEAIRQCQQVVELRVLVFFSESSEQS